MAQNIWRESELANKQASSAVRKMLVLVRGGEEMNGNKPSNGNLSPQKR